jgi:hypothetical protein
MHITPSGTEDLSSSRPPVTICHRGERLSFPFNSDRGGPRAAGSFAAKKKTTFQIKYCKSRLKILMACEFSACHFGAPRIWAHISASAGGVPTPYRRVRIFSEMEGSLLAPSQSLIILFDRIRDEHCVIPEIHLRIFAISNGISTILEQPNRDLLHCKSACSFPSTF